eukprot:TRINITY_DN20805_c1_g1_i2.p1 TRINITY_DN20805_c1_g1~~TRINITY_DN20805_c1_g1_i2.p1  ORF type:complete len:585 (+),score=106.88 TRINITY_DN20805_c1_g1_i2:31-1785(+)
MRDCCSAERLIVSALVVFVVGVLMVFIDVCCPSAGYPKLIPSMQDQALSVMLRQAACTNSRAPLLKTREEAWLRPVLGTELLAFPRTPSAASSIVRSRPPRLASSAGLVFCTAASAVVACNVRRQRGGGGPRCRGCPRAGSAAVAELRSVGEPVVGDSDELPRVILKRGKERLIAEGRSMVYDGSVTRLVGDAGPGDLVEVCDSLGQVVAWGTYNPHSLYRVRVLQRASEVERIAGSAGRGFSLRTLLRHRLAIARSTRRALGLPKQDVTNAYRLINADGDGLSGLTVDVYDSVAVIRSAAAWAERHRPVIEDVVRETLTDVAAPEEDLGIRVIWRRSDGHLEQDGVVAAQTGDAEDKWDEELTIVENGLRFQVRPGVGQKTGHYLDQRENRAMVGEVVAAQSRPPKVLDCCCYHGAFSLSALKNGAASVTAVDSSEDALEVARRNAELNGLNTDGRLRLERADVAAFLADAVAAGHSYDIIVLDPPKLAPLRRKDAFARAESKYQSLNAMAMKLVGTGGLLLTCTCSAAMTQSGRFVQMLGAAACAAKRDVTVLRTTHAAADHTVAPACQEAAYLTAVLLRVA